MFSLGLPTNIYGVFIVKGECRALRAENSRVARRGAEEGKQTRTLDAPVSCWIWGQASLQTPPVILPRSLQNSAVYCVVYRALWGRKKEQTTQSGAGSSQETRAPS